ncbi:hypothetical protein AARAC_005374 [Aspergillus arachidicola]|uniref:Capsule polysaccharide biosynthesis protein n=1 Tax=Aspergillus arachidicola TaxID=656916 RepID=A0A2G7G1C7_9EURO|nr:hypothetical protein AARAC_005374 [Aspergillus arachidicola]
MGLPVSLRADTIRDLLLGVSSIMTWKTLALVLAVINLKNLPLVWHLRILHHLWWNIRRKPGDPHFPRGKALVTHTGKPTHPVFVPYAITSRTPILETDYNFHKSNSTYFSDLDISRTALVTRLYTPGLRVVSKELDVELGEAARREGKKPPAHKNMYVALGSVFCSFKREIKPFELYEIETKPAKAGGKRTLFATAVSKYVVKKGRLTVPPERVLRASGFLPERPEGDVLVVPDSSVEGSGVGTPAGEGITATAGVDGALVREVLKVTESDIPETKLEAEKKANAESWSAGDWTWEMIEEERTGVGGSRGLYQYGCEAT